MAKPNYSFEKKQKDLAKKKKKQDKLLKKLEPNSETAIAPEPQTDKLA